MSTPRSRGLSSKLFINLKFVLDDLFIRRGFYDNITSGTYNYLNQDKSQLVPDASNEDFPGTDTTAVVWESYADNWIYESGVDVASGLTTPIIASGVYVDNVFHPRSAISGNNDGISLDFLNGRVLIESGAPIASTIRADFSRKEVYVDAPDALMRQVLHSPRINVFRATDATILPTGVFRTLPQVITEFDVQEPFPLSLGRGRFVRQNMTMWVVSDNEYEKMDIMDAIGELYGKKFPLVDIDNTIFPLNDFNDLNPGALTLTQMQSTKRIISPVTGQIISMYFNKITQKNEPMYDNNLFVGRVDIQVEVDDVDYLFTLD